MISLGLKSEKVKDLTLNKTIVGKYIINDLYINYLFVYFCIIRIDNEILL